MDKNDLNERLRALGLYSEYYHRLELKPLANMLQVDEKLLCILTGVNEGRRRMLAVTDYRLIIIGAGAVTSGEVTTIKRSAVTAWKFDRRFLLSSVTVNAAGKDYEFRQTQAARKELFEKAMGSAPRVFGD